MSEKKTTDEIMIGPEISPGVHTGIRRQDGETSHVLIGPAEDGQPLQPGVEIADMEGRCRDGWHTITSVYKSGPAQVATPAYREGYDRIFGKKKEVGIA